LSTLDLARRYWQVPVVEESQACTAFTKPYGFYQSTVMPFGLSGVPATFQHMIDRIIRVLEGYSAAHLDDLVVYSSGWEDRPLHMVFDRLKQAELTVKPSKCQFARLGHSVYI